MEAEKQSQQPCAARHSVENLLISSHDVIGRSISPNLTFSAMASSSLPNPLTEGSLDSSSAQSSCASSAPSPSVQTRAHHHKRDVSRGSDASDVQLPESLEMFKIPSVLSTSTCSLDSSNALTAKKEKEGKLSDSSRTDKVDKPPSERSANKKKSSWYNVLYPTYKTRSEGFKRIFRDLPADERLVVDYSCALQRDILVHGRLYVSPNYLSFYANIFGWETSVTVPWRQVTGLTKEKTALVIPNAIQVSTSSNERLFFTSFGARDKTFLMLFRIWQNALLDQSLSSQELWQWVHACYGDELGLTSDDEDYVSSTGLEDEQNNSLNSSCNQNSLDLSLKVGDLPPLDLQVPPPLVSAAVTPEFGELPDFDFAPPNLPINSSPLRSPPMPVPGQENAMMAPITPDMPPATAFTPASSDILQTDLSDTTESDAEKSSSDIFKRAPPACLAVLPVCPGPHEGKLSLDQVFPLPVDQLFALLFTTSTFFVAFHTARKTVDIQASSWQPNKETGLKVRQISFTASVNQTVGPKTCHVHETQTMLSCSRPGRMYVIEIEANNSHIPYADSFYLQNHFCLLRVSESQCRLTVYNQIKYRKSVWGLVKGFIEKNTWAGVEDFYTSLDRALAAEAEALLEGEPTSGGKRKSRIIRHRRARGHLLSSSNGESMGHGASVVGDIPPITRKPLVAQLVGGLTDRGVRGGEPGGLWSWGVLIILLLLLLLNAVLYHKLWSLEAWGREAGRLEIPLLKHPPQSHDDWLRLLQHQEMLHRREMQNWQRFLDTAVSLLRQAEESLKQLQQTITPDLLTPKPDSVWSSRAEGSFTEDPPDGEETVAHVKEL